MGIGKGNRQVAASVVCLAVGIQLGTRSPDESLAGYMLVVMTMASEGIILRVGSVILESVPVARFSLGENLSTCWTSDGGALGVVTSLEASLVETHLGQFMEDSPVAW